jgi:hypothetical protein
MTGDERDKKIELPCSRPGVCWSRSFASRSGKGKHSATVKQMEESLEKMRLRKIEKKLDRR